MNETDFQDNLTTLRELEVTFWRFETAYPRGYGRRMSIARQVAQDILHAIASGLDSDPTTAY